MYKQMQFLRQAVTMVRNQTFRLDLPKSGMLSGLLLQISADCVVGATLAGGAWRLDDFLGKIEIIGNGATIIKSYNWCDILFLTWLHQGIVPPAQWRNYAGNTQQTWGVILFGRYLNDPQYGLELSHWDSVEIRITNSATAAFYSNDLAVTILQTLLREAPGSYQGYIRSEQWRQWTTVAAGIDYEVLPSEYPICTLAIQGVPAATLGMFNAHPFDLDWDIDLSKAGGTKQIYKGGADMLLVQNYIERGSEIITGGQADLTALRGIDVGISEMMQWVAGASSRAGNVATVIPTLEGDDVDGTIQFEARQVDHPIDFMVRGMGYWDFVWLLANLTLDPDANLDPKVDGECRLNTTTRNSAGAAAGTNRILLERVVS